MFYIRESKFLSLIISIESIFIDLYKVNIIFNRLLLTSPYHVRSYLRFYNFYPCFIQNFSKSCNSLTGFTEKDTIFDQTLAYQLAFDNLKNIVTKISILAHYKQGLRTIQEANFWTMSVMRCFLSWTKIDYYILCYFFLKISILLNTSMRFMIQSCWLLSNVLNN